jgi:DNA modification methylase/ParB-like chromosome segregation protein Spo0J
MEAKVGTTKLINIIVEDRFRKDYGDITLLTKDITENGIIQPLAVAEDVDGTYKLLAGGRRYAALMTIEDYALGNALVPIRIYSGELDERGRRIIELSENIHRKNLTWQEEVDLKEEIDRLMKEQLGEKSPTTKGGHSSKDTAKLLDESPGLLSEDLYLAEMKRKLPELAGAKNKSEAKRMLKKVTRNLIMTEAVRKVREDRRPIDAKVKDLIDSYIVRDTQDFAAKAVDKTFDLIEVDPPYAIDLKNIKRKEGNTSGNLESYNEIDAETYIQNMKCLLINCYRLLKDDGWLLLWYGIHPWHQQLLDLLTEVGFLTRGIPAIWVKHSGQTMQPSIYLGNSYETFFYARKSGASIINKPGRLTTFDYREVKPDNKIHPTEKPIELMVDIYSTFCKPGSLIYIPYAGSGNGLLAAANYQCRAIGCDLSQLYKDLYSSRVISVEYGQYASYPMVGAI